MSVVNAKPELQNIPSDEIPNWLNEEFFVGILRKESHNKTSGDDFKVKIISVKPAAAVGENYAATVYRVAITVQNKLLSFIIKAMKESTQEIFNLPIFETEMKMYNEIIPGLENEFKKIGEEVHFGPKCYYTEEKPKLIIVLEDLRVRGYSLQDRFTGVNEEHFETYLTKLAKFHAATAVYNEKHDLQSYNKTIYTDESSKKFMLQYFNGSFKFFLEEIRKNETLKPLAGKLEKWEDGVFDELERIWTADSSSFNVLLHGDSHLNNVLYSHGEEKAPNDLLLIDFQIVCWGTPILDILYFFITSTHNDLADVNKFDSLIYLYHAELSSNLRKLGYTQKIPTLKDLHIDILKKGFWASYCTFVVGIVFIEASQGATLENLAGESNDGDSFQRAVYQNPRYIRRIEKLLPFLDKKGCLDL